MCVYVTFEVSHLLSQKPNTMYQIVSSDKMRSTIKQLAYIEKISLDKYQKHHSY